MKKILLALLFSGISAVALAATTSNSSWTVWEVLVSIGLLAFAIWACIKMFHALTWKRHTIVQEHYYNYPLQTDLQHTVAYEAAVPRRAVRDSGYTTSSATVVQQPAAQQQGVGIMGQIAATAGGVVVGNMITDMLHSRNHGDYDGDRYNIQDTQRHGIERIDQDNTYSSSDSIWDNTSDISSSDSDGGDW